MGKIWGAIWGAVWGGVSGTVWGDDLGQYILKALSDKQGIGNGLTLGLCVAFIGLAVDSLIRTWSSKRKKIIRIRRILNL